MNTTTTYPHYADLTYIESGWLYLLTAFGPELMSTAVTLVYLLLVYFFLSVPYTLIYKYKPAFLYKYKIQDAEKTEKARNPDDWTCIKQLLFNHFLILLPSAFGIYPALRYINAEFSLPLPSWTDTFLRCFAYFVIEDTFFYWGHRFLHTKWAYNNIHHQHHQYSAPIAMASSYAHPIEFMFLGTGFAVGPAIIGVNHLFTLWIWTLVRQAEALDCHSGFDFPWHLSKFVPFYCGPHHHDHHHKTYSGNFASTFVWWDWICGTDVKYRKDCEKEKKMKKLN